MQEEPENGIHPANIEAMVDLVRDLAVDAHETPGPDNTFRQVIINTHSPYIVQLVDPQDLLFAETALLRAPDGTVAVGPSSGPSSAGSAKPIRLPQNSSYLTNLPRFGIPQ